MLLAALALLLSAVKSKYICDALFAITHFWRVGKLACRSFGKDFLTAKRGIEVDNIICKRFHGKGLTTHCNFVITENEGTCQALDYSLQLTTNLKARRLSLSPDGGLFLFKRPKLAA